jgi:hypothetical protein
VRLYLKSLWSEAKLLNQTALFEVIPSISTSPAIAQFRETEASKRIIGELVRMNKYGHKEGYF